jgi:PTH1 family peptidyl-tRNA hydrolase
MKYLVFGLGNIGPEYASTRHNAGFMVVDKMAADAEVKWESARYAWRADVKHRGRTYILLKPTTFMNLSGKAVRYWLKKENVPVEKTLTVVDDIALTLGTLRMKKQGGAGGHNGLESIIEQIGTNAFPRLRIGIGDDFNRGYQVDWVLGEWLEPELEILVPKLETAVKMIQSFGTIGIDRTMNLYNNS